MPRGLGAALRTASLVAGGKQGLPLLEEAVEVLRETPAKLEHAKAHAELGAALRRATASIYRKLAISSRSQLAAALAKPARA